LKAASASPLSAKARQISVALAGSPFCHASTPDFTVKVAAAGAGTGMAAARIAAIKKTRIEYSPTQAATTLAEPSDAATRSGAY
jgi:hypothetical protein